MVTPKIFRTSAWCPFWGAIDIAGIALYAINSIHHGSIPLIPEISEGARVFQSDANLLPLVLSMAGALLLLSNLASGILLIRKQRIGLWLAISQTPVRFALVAPSLFFLQLDAANKNWAPALIALWISTEIFKLWSIWPLARVDDKS